MSRIFKVGAAVFLVLYLLIFLLSLSLRQKAALRAPERIMVLLATPAQSLVGGTYDWAGGLWSRYVSLIGTKERNEALTRENETLRRKLVELSEVSLENARLRTALELGPKMGLTLLGAERIASGVSPYERTVRIRRGKDDGVESGMAVVAAGGVVGQVADSYDHYSDVLLLADPASAIDVVVTRSRAGGILRGEQFARLRFEYLAKDADVVAGDVVVSSGLDGVYPEGVPVGVVTKVEKVRRSLFLGASVRPYVDFTRLEEVSVVMKGKPK